MVLHVTCLINTFVWNGSMEEFDYYWFSAGGVRIYMIFVHISLETNRIDLGMERK